jgi:hypothetical protein
VYLTGCKNPFLVPGESFRFNKAYMSWRAAMAAKKLMGQPYQRPGACPRGDANPEVGATLSRIDSNVVDG